MNKAQKLSQQISVRVSQDMYDAIAEIAVFEKRRPNEVARLLLERGLADYISNRELFLDTPVDYLGFKKEEKRIEITVRRANE